MALRKSAILCSASETLEYHKKVFCNCINILYLIFLSKILWYIVILLLWKFHNKSFPEKIIPIEEYDNWKISTPLFWKRKFMIRHRSYPRYKMPSWYLIRIVQTHLHAKGFVELLVGTIVYKTVSNYNELCRKYHLLSIFFYKSYRSTTKGVLFSDCNIYISIMYWQYILISCRMRRLHLLLLYVGHCCITKWPSSFSIFNVYRRIFRRALVWKYCKYKEWVMFQTWS